MPYREPATMPVTDRCDICGQPGVHCAPCAAVFALHDDLELPVVFAGSVWSRGNSFIGAGLVLVDRWRRIASCAFRIEVSSSMRHNDAELYVRARAARWSPAARIPKKRRDYDEALLESLRRTHFVDYGAVRKCFADGMIRALDLAAEAQDSDYRGTWIEA